MIAFIEAYKVAHGVEPICRVLPIAPSTFYAHAAIARDPDLASGRAKQDGIDRKMIKDAFDDSGKRYGARKIWHELRRNNHDIARCTVERLMKVMGIQGPSRQISFRNRLPGNGCARSKADHDQPGYISAVPG